MPPNLDWHVDRSADLEPPPIQPAGAGPPRRPIRPRPWLLAGYLLALVGAGWIGFHIGRWSEIGATNLQAIQNQLSVESLAWRERDLGLYQTTLDPTARRRWRAHVVREFLADPMRNRSLRLAQIEKLSADRLRVIVEIETPTGRRTEARTYRLHKGGWYHTGQWTPSAADGG